MTDYNHAKWREFVVVLGEKWRVVTGIAESSGSYNRVPNEVSNRNQLQVFSAQFGGGDHTLATTPDDLIKKAVNFPESLTEGNNADFLATFESYEILNRPPDA